MTETEQVAKDEPRDDGEPAEKRQKLDPLLAFGNGESGGAPPTSGAIGSADVEWGLMQPKDDNDGDASGENYLLGMPATGQVGRRAQLCLAKIMPNTPAGDPLVLAEYKKVGVNAMADVCCQFGGVQQYLQATYPTKEARQKFADRLVEMFPLADDVEYHWRMNIPKYSESNQDSYTLHLSLFSFADLASPKPCPEPNVSMQLVDQYLVDGFVSSLDVVKISMHLSLQRDKLKIPFEEVPLAMGAQTVGYVKGQARVLTLLALVSMTLEDGVDLAQVHPTLYESIRTLGWQKKRSQHTNTQTHAHRSRDPKQ